MNPAIEPSHLLTVRDLCVSVFSRTDPTDIIHDVSLTLCRNEVLVLLGESGSGKTILSRSITKLFPRTRPMSVKGSVIFEGRELLSLDQAELAPIRQNKIRYVFQEPLQSLNPLADIRTQLRLSGGLASGNDSACHETLRSVGLDADVVLNLFPHQLSIGMAQRVCIAMAILPSPSLLVADEPTSAVDSSLRDSLLDVMMSIQRNTGMSLMLITHDIDVARRMGDTILVLYAGRIVESASCEAFFKRQLHPYSQLLARARPGPVKGMMTTGPASPGAARTASGNGCRFCAYCPEVQERCYQSEPELEQTSDGREIRCFYWK